MYDDEEQRMFDVLDTWGIDPDDPGELPAWQDYVSGWRKINPNLSTRDALWYVLRKINADEHLGWSEGDMTQHAAYIAQWIDADGQLPIPYDPNVPQENP